MRTSIGNGVVGGARLKQLVAVSEKPNIPRGRRGRKDDIVRAKSVARSSTVPLGVTSATKKRSREGKSDRIYQPPNNHNKLGRGQREIRRERGDESVIGERELAIVYLPR